MSAAIEEVQQVRERPYDPMEPEEETYGANCCGRTYCKFTPTRRIQAIGVIAGAILLLALSAIGMALTATKSGPVSMVFPAALGGGMPIGLIALFGGILYGWDD